MTWRTKATFSKIKEGRDHWSHWGWQWMWWEDLWSHSHSVPTEAQATHGVVCEWMCKPWGTAYHEAESLGTVSGWLAGGGEFCDSEPNPPVIPGSSAQISWQPGVSWHVNEHSQGPRATLSQAISCYVMCQVQRERERGDDMEAVMTARTWQTAELCSPGAEQKHLYVSILKVSKLDTPPLSAKPQVSLVRLFTSLQETLWEPSNEWWKQSFWLL